MQNNYCKAQFQFDWLDKTFYPAFELRYNDDNLDWVVLHVKANLHHFLSLAKEVFKPSTDCEHVQ